MYFAQLIDIILITVSMTTSCTLLPGFCFCQLSRH